MHCLFIKVAVVMSKNIFFSFFKENQSYMAASVAFSEQSFHFINTWKLYLMLQFLNHSVYLFRIFKSKVFFFHYFRK